VNVVSKKLSPDRAAASEAVPTSGTGKKRAIAFFDLDGTLVVGQTTLMLVSFLRRAGIVSRSFVVGTGLWFLGYKLGLLKVTERSRNQGARVFAGRSEKEVERLMKRFAEEVLAPRFHPAATAALAEHQAGDDRVVVVSAALEPVVEAVCQRLGVADFVGTACEVQEGAYSGRLLGPSPHGGEKERLAEEYMRRWGVEAAQCWAYADHGSDLALLRAVGHPVAVNPKPELLAVAQQAGWQVLP
jgi:HAD superfamily hydrolase (TIGR01490 family)